MLHSSHSIIVKFYPPDLNRTRNMAFAGVSIGASFIISIILGPFIAYNFGIKIIFLFSFISSIFSIFVVYLYIENVNKNDIVNINILSKYKGKIFNRSLLTLYLGIFTIHANLTSLFLFIPKLLIQTSDFILHSIKFYTPVLFLSLMFDGEFSWLLLR